MILLSAPTTYTVVYGGADIAICVTMWMCMLARDVNKAGSFKAKTKAKARDQG